MVFAWRKRFGFNKSKIIKWVHDNKVGVGGALAFEFSPLLREYLWIIFFSRQRLALESRGWVGWELSRGNWLIFQCKELFLGPGLTTVDESLELWRCWHLSPGEAIVKRNLCSLTDWSSKMRMELMTTTMSMWMKIRNGGSTNYWRRPRRMCCRANRPSCRLRQPTPRWLRLSGCESEQRS